MSNKKTRSPLSSNMRTTLELSLRTQKDNLKIYISDLTSKSLELSHSEVRHLASKIMTCKADISKLEKLLSL